MKSANVPLHRCFHLLPRARITCWSCWQVGRKWSCLRGRTFHSSSSNRLLRRDEKISSIARRIRETGELPALPTASTFELPTLPRQRKLRDQNIIRDDIKATVDAHYATNVLAHGNIHIKLGDGSYPEPRKLAVTPPNHTPWPSSANQQITRYGRIDDVLGSTTRVLKNGRQNNLARFAEEDGAVVATSGFRERLSEIDPDLDATQRLDAEIRIFQDWIEPNQDEHDAAADVWLRFQQIVHRRFPEYELQLHGSRASGLARPFSDVDVELSIRKFAKADDGYGQSTRRKAVRESYKSALYRIRGWLQAAAAKDFTASTVRQGRIPLLEIQDRRQTCLKLQLCAALGKPAKYKTDFTKYFRTEYPQIKPLYLLTRWWLEMADIGDASKGGVSSYLTFCMILTSITHSGISCRDEELGKQFLHFLKFWIRADWTSLGFAPDPPRAFPKFAVNIVEESALDDDTTQEFGPGIKQTTINLPIDAQDDIHYSQSSPTQEDDMSSHPGADQDSVQNSDVYLEGIKLLTRQANNLCRTSDQKHAYLLLQDPADPRENIGKSVKRLPELQSLMKRALRNLEQRLGNWEQRKLASETSQTQQFLLQDLVYMSTGGDSTASRPDKAVQDFEKRRLRLAIDMAKKARSEQLE